MKKGIITNTVCIVTAIVCIALTFWGNLKNDGVLSTDAYMGIIATLIGICATIVVGFQIVSFMEFRNFREQIKKLDDQQQQVKALHDKMQQDNQKLQAQIHSAKIDLSNAFISIADYDTLSDKKNKTLLKITLYCFAILSDSMKNDKGGVVTLARYTTLHNLIKSVSPDDLIGIKERIKPLEEIKIPDNWPEHHKIMKLHYDIISIIDNLKEKPTAETEQK